MPYFTVTFFLPQNLKKDNCHDCIDVQTDRLHKAHMKNISFYNLYIIDEEQDFT